jgi:glycosyltransferase involved in cell wall biosynthesis
LHADYDQRYKLDGKRGAPTILGSRKLIYPIECFTLRNAVGVLPIRKSLIPYAVKRGVNPKYIGVIPHGINLDRYRSKSDINIRKKFNLSIDQKVLAFVGRLSSENYLDDLLLAVRNVCITRKDVVLILAGGGGLEDCFAEKVKDDPILSRGVHMVGYISPEVVCALRQQCDVSLCLMAGYSLIEACAGGRPIVAYNVEWHHELVINGKTGYLVPEHDISAVSNAINLLLDDPRQSNLMGQHARQLAFDLHGIEGTTEIKRNHYAKILRED